MMTLQKIVNNLMNQNHHSMVSRYSTVKIQIPSVHLTTGIPLKKNRMSDSEDEEEENEIEEPVLEAQITLDDSLVSGLESDEEED